MGWSDDRAYRVAKRVLDVALSGAATVGLAPVMLGCAAAVRLTSPGPVIFRQTRSGIHLREFDMLKFRTMRTDTPQLPSHMIDANEWLTPVGGFLRRTSLDELPQLLNILRGDMSIVGPRPPLPSQEDLIVERAKYGANDVPVGLTGWAQVNGRDELPVARKAALDGDYVRDASLLFDAHVVLMTIAKVFRHEGVVEAKVPEPGTQSAEGEKSVTGGSGNHRVLVLANLDITITYFRLELMEALLEQGYEVHVACPFGEHVSEITAVGCTYHETNVSRHGKSPLEDMGLMLRYLRLMREVAPDVVLAYTIKPNVYGGMASAKCHLPFVANVTGLGTSIEGGGPLQTLTLGLYRAGLRKAHKVFFQNEANRDFMVSRGIAKERCELLPGSGVNTAKYSTCEYPTEENGITFLTVGRIMRDKGTEELIAAARIVKERHRDAHFILVGMYDDDCEDAVSSAVSEGVITHVPAQLDVRPYYANCHALVHPSWHEGMSNVCLEAAASARPVIASDIPGCREVFDDGVSGIGFKPRNVESLVAALERFIAMPREERRDMGLAGREKVIREFDRQMVVDRYLAEIGKIAAS